MDWVHFVHRLCTCRDIFNRALVVRIRGPEAVAGRCPSGAVVGEASVWRNGRSAATAPLAHLQPVAGAVELRVVAADDRAAGLAACRQPSTVTLGVRP